MICQFNDLNEAVSGFLPLAIMPCFFKLLKVFIVEFLTMTVAFTYMQGSINFMMPVNLVLYHTDMPQAASFLLSS